MCLWKIIKSEKNDRVQYCEDSGFNCNVKLAGASIKGEGILDYALEKMMDCNDNECRIHNGRETIFVWLL